MAQNFSNTEEPFLIDFPKFGDREHGFIGSTQVKAAIPFSINRVFWTYGIPDRTLRGKHANRETKEVLVVVNGKVEIETETATGKKSFILSDPQQGLYIPAMCWADLKFSENAIVVCLASTDFNEQDYIRDYTEFKHAIGRK